MPAHAPRTRASAPSAPPSGPERRLLAPARPRHRPANAGTPAKLSGSPASRPVMLRSVDPGLQISDWLACPHQRFTRRTVPVATPPGPSVAAGPLEPCRHCWASRAQRLLSPREQRKGPNSIITVGPESVVIPNRAYRYRGLGRRAPRGHVARLRSGTPVDLPCDLERSDRQRVDAPVCSISSSSRWLHPPTTFRPVSRAWESREPARQRSVEPVVHALAGRERTSDSASPHPPPRRSEVVTTSGTRSIWVGSERRYPCSSHGAREPSTAKLACPTKCALGNGPLCGAIVG